MSSVVRVGPRMVGVYRTLRSQFGGHARTHIHTHTHRHTHTHNRFNGYFPGEPGSASCPL